jgi:hypothetical protein
MKPEIVEVVNDDGTVTRTQTTTWPDGSQQINIRKLTAQNIQDEQNRMQSSIADLSKKLTASQSLTAAIQNKVAQIK